MIHQVSGDILLTQAHAIAHGIASNDPMSRGLALSLHQQYPSMHKDFHHWCHVKHPKPGSAWIWGGVNGARIISLITQEGGYGHGSHPGKATLKHLRDSLKELIKIIKSEKIKSIALPRLATGVGGLSWNDVFPIIEEVLDNINIPVYVYSEYHADKQAKEPAS